MFGILFILCAIAFCFSLFGRFILVPVVSIFSKTRADIGRERSKRLIKITFYCLCASIAVEIFAFTFFAPWLKVF